MSEIKWYDANKTFPLTSRVVVMRFDEDGQRDADGFFWAPERAWYRSDGGKATRHAVHPVAWRENVEPVAMRAMRGLVVCLEDGVYLAPWSGDPGRTRDRNAARTFTSAKEARKAIAWARRFRPFEHAKIEYA